MKTSAERNAYSEYVDQLTSMGYRVRTNFNKDGTNDVKISSNKVNSVNSMQEEGFQNVAIHEGTIVDFKTTPNFADAQAMDILNKILCISPKNRSYIPKGRIHICEKDYMLVSVNHANGQLACLELNPNMILGFNYAYFYHIKDIPKDKIDKFLYTKEEAQRWVTPAIKMVSYTESVKKHVVLY